MQYRRWPSERDRGGSPPDSGPARLQRRTFPGGISGCPIGADFFHVVRIDSASRLTGIEPVADMDMRINGGYFILRREIFDYLQPGDDLVTDTFTRAARGGKFRAVRFDGFWAPMDTLKERAALEAMHRSGNRPWALWESPASELATHTPVRSLPLPQIRSMLRDQSAQRISSCS